MQPLRRHHVDPGQHVVVDRDPHVFDRLDQPVGPRRLDVGDEHRLPGIARFVRLAHHPSHPVDLPQERRELGLAGGSTRRPTGWADSR